MVAVDRQNAVQRRGENEQQKTLEEHSIGHGFAATTKRGPGVVDADATGAIAPR